MGEKTSNEMGNLSLQTKNRFPRDLLQRFRVGTDPIGSDPEEDTGEELELNLGLSLGGRFGVDKSNNKLVRSSSIASILPVVRDEDVLGGTSQGQTGPDGSYSTLIRTSSLPVETEEEWRKRKELQSLRRLAAKRRRSEKQRSVSGGVGLSPVPSRGSGNWVSGWVAKQSGLTAGGSGGFEGLIGKGVVTGGVTPVTGSVTGGGGFTQPSSQGSMDSQASSMSEFESRHLQGSSSGGEASPVNLQPVQERIGQDATGPSRSKTVEPTARLSRPESENVSRTRVKETTLNTAEMPCVFTQGDGPSGRRIEGILYKYGKGEEVKIMCVCHGSFLSPAEFVRHAGGTDVVNPLKHIVVNPNSSSYL